MNDHYCSDSYAVYENAQQKCTVVLDTEGYYTGVKLKMKDDFSKKGFRVSKKENCFLDETGDLYSARYEFKNTSVQVLYHQNYPSLIGQVVEVRRLKRKKCKVFKVPGSSAKVPGS